MASLGQSGKIKICNFAKMKVEPRASLRVMFITLDGCKRLMAERILSIATVHIFTYSAYI